MLLVLDLRGSGAASRLNGWSAPVALIASRPFYSLDRVRELRNIAVCAMTRGRSKSVRVAK